MKKKIRKRKAKWIHKWFSLTLFCVIIVWVLSGILLNHRHIIRGVDIPRSYLPSNYKMNSWNQAGLRDGLRINSEQLILYGEEGCFLTNNSFSEFHSFNDGLPKGSDSRKIYSIKKYKESLFAATNFGLFHKTSLGAPWELFCLGANDELRIVDLAIKDNFLFVASRSNIFQIDLNDRLLASKKITLLVNDQDLKKVSLFKTIWLIHSGALFGFWGRIFVDLIGLSLLFFCFSGILIWWLPKRIKKKAEKKDACIKRFKWNFKYHKKIGLYLAVFLLIVSVTGMFLRPPLLIPIAEKKINKIPGSVLDNTSPYYDNIRKIFYDKESDLILLGTTNGIYKFKSDFSDKPILVKEQPPISVMGINVLAKDFENRLVVGSFQGLYIWEPNEEDYVLDYFSGIPPKVQKKGPPVGKNMAVGLIGDNKTGLFYIDYNKGAICIKRGEANELIMPSKISDESKMSLWNLALEIHTGRIFQFILGKFYILIVPLLGLSCVFIFISGLILCFKKKKTSSFNNAVIKKE
ncbi:MAG: PepSY domain-containing protein [Bacteroidales bacterium]